MKDYTVIYYHNIVEGKGESYQRTGIDNFKEQMKFLSENGYNTINFSDIDKCVKGKNVLIVFDDGFKCVYEKAYPIMKELGIKGNVFILPKYTDEKDDRFISIDNIKEMSANGFEFGAHTTSHIDLRTLGYSELSRDCEEVDEWFINNLGKKSDDFCMPYGKYMSKQLRILKKYYKRVYTSLYGSNKFKKAVIKRIGISDSDGIEKFKAKLDGKYDYKGSLQRVRLFVDNVRGNRVTEYDM